MANWVNVAQTKLKEYSLKEEEAAAFLGDVKKMLKKAMAGANGTNMEKAILLAAEKRALQGESAH